MNEQPTPKIVGKRLISKLTQRCDFGTFISVNGGGDIAGARFMSRNLRFKCRIDSLNFGFGFRNKPFGFGETQRLAFNAGNDGEKRLIGVGATENVVVRRKLGLVSISISLI